MELDSALARAVPHGASDVHLKVGRPPMLRKDGDIVTLDGAGTPRTHSSGTRSSHGGRTQRAEQFRESGDLDIAYTADELPRFRVNVFRQRGATSMALRVIPARGAAFH